MACAVSAGTASFASLVFGTGAFDRSLIPSGRAVALPVLTPSTPFTLRLIARPQRFLSHTFTCRIAAKPRLLTNLILSLLPHPFYSQIFGASRGANSVPGQAWVEVAPATGKPAPPSASPYRAHHSPCGPPVALSGAAWKTNHPARVAVRNSRITKALCTLVTGLGTSRVPCFRDMCLFRISDNFWPPRRPAPLATPKPHPF